MPRVGRICQRAVCYVRQVADGVTEQNPYVGEFTEQDRRDYSEALMSGADEKIVKLMEGERAIGTREFAATLEMAWAADRGSGDGGDGVYRLCAGLPGFLDVASVGQHELRLDGVRAVPLLIDSGHNGGTP